MHVYVAISLNLINWLLGLFVSTQKNVHISDHSNKTDGSSPPLHILLLTIVIGLLLLNLCRLKEKKELNPISNEVDHEEPEYPEVELDHDFDRDHEEPEHPERESDHDRPLIHRDNEHRDMAKIEAACAFCGNLSTTRCPRCKVARYCSVDCQIEHWRTEHRNECVEIETEEGEARHVNDQGTSILVEKYDNESIPNGSHGNEVDGSSSCDLNHSHIGCEVCGRPSTTRCSRCKAVRYCSTMCLIMNWRWHKSRCVEGDVSSAPTNRSKRNVGVLKHSNEEQENINSSAPLYLEYHPEGTSNSKSPTRVSKVTTTKDAQVHKTQWVLEDELLKSKKEIFSLKSERDEWKKRANFAREWVQRFKEESEQKLSLLRNENESISNAEKKACNVIHSLHERLNHLQIAVEENIAEKKRLEEYTQMVESDCAKLKKELQEEHKQALYRTLDSKKSHETTQIAIREVEEVRQELLEEREHFQRVKENFFRDVTFAKSRANFAEAKLGDIQRKIKLTDPKVLGKTESLGWKMEYWTSNLAISIFACTICLANEKDMAFGCGHMTCRDCGSQLSKCPICREDITSHIKLFPGS